MGDVRARTYIASLAAFAVLLCASWIHWHGVSVDPRLLAGTAVLALLILACDALPVRINEWSSIGASDIGFIAAVVLLGPTWAAVAALPTALFIAKRDWLRAAYEMSQSIIIVYLSGMVFSLVSGPLLISAPDSIAATLYGTFVACVMFLGSNGVIDGVLLKVKYGQSFRQTWEEVWQPYLLSDVVKVLTVCVGVLALVVYSPVAAMVVVGGSIGSQALVYRSQAQVREIEALRERVGSLEGALSGSNVAFGTMVIEDLGRKDGYTHRHAAATSVYARDLALEMKLDEVTAGRLQMAGLLHNVGLFGVPDDLLLSTGKPNSVAQNLLSKHPQRGEAALAAVPEFEDMASWVRWHHERPDGRGYPDKLRGAWIPLEARILAVAQAYAAMVLDKPNQPGLSFAQAREKLSAGVDSEFDGLVVRAFLRILDTRNEGYRQADDHRFVFGSSAGSAPRAEIPDTSDNVS